MKQYKPFLWAGVLLIAVGFSAVQFAIHVKKLTDALNQSDRWIEQKNGEIDRINAELVRKNNEIQDLNRKMDELTQSLEQVNTRIDNPHFNVFEEKLIAKQAEMLLPDSMSISKVKALLGEPLNIEEDIEAHGSGKVFILNYKEASFTFNKEDEKESIKWYRLKSPHFITNRGITIGSSRDEVKGKYGLDYSMYQENNNEIRIGEKTGIAFSFEQDLVKEIVVWFVYE